MEFVFVKGGCFAMGDTLGDGYFAEHPVHEVCVDDFYLGKYEVMQGEWTQIMFNEPSCPAKSERFPVVCVNYADILSFVEKMSKRTERKIRLPTEAEWEYACRSKGGKERYSGFSEKDFIFRYANFCDVNCNYDWVTGDQDDGHKDAAPAGSFLPNSLGLYDMSGNVWEWVSDWFDEDYFNKSPQNNPAGPQSGNGRVVRGGCWLNSPNYLRCSYRFGLNPELRENDIGFRVVMEK
jgi:formylglycine-generating enzyme required for sulfatase activity